MEDKEKQMVQLGAKLIEPNMGDKTATQAEIDSADNSSILSTIAANEQDAYINAISWVQLFMNDSQDFVFELNKKFGIAQLNAQEITALMAALQSGGISKESFLWNMKQGHRIPEDITIEDELGRIVNNVTLIE
jgi:predicted Zn-dependent peptidase